MQKKNLLGSTFATHLNYLQNNKFVGKLIIPFITQCLNFTAKSGNIPTLKKYLLTID